MNNLKICFVIVLMLFLSGCMTTYELEIDGEKFEEKITTYIYSNDRETAVYDDESTASRIDAFVERDVYPFFEKYEKVYDKEVNKTDEYEQVILKYRYSAEEYKNSNSINLCFENRSFDITDDYYDIDLSGYFYCLYDNDVVNIEIKTDNKVLSHNAQEHYKNKYIWKIDSTNFKDVNLQIKLGKENRKNIIYIIMGSIGLVVLIILALVAIRRKIEKANKL